MSSLSTLLAGRKKESPVWEFFKYCTETDKSVCQVRDGKTEEKCGTALSGKNSSNLISHLQRLHKEAHAEYLEKNSEKDKAKTALNLKRHAADSSSAVVSTRKTQTIQECFSKRHVTWSPVSSEHLQREKSVVNMLVESGYPVTMCDLPSFREMISAMDPKFKLPGSAKMNQLIAEQYRASCEKLEQLLQQARRITISLDGWTKKGLAVSYLGISACFFEATSGKARHFILDLMELKHPHTGEALHRCLEQSLSRWKIPERKILLIVSDNGSNMVKAVKLLQSKFRSDNSEINQDVMEEMDDDDDEEEEDSEEPEADVLQLPSHVPFRRMPCMAHTLQLLIKPVYAHFQNVLSKARHVVGKIRKSSVAMEKLVSRCGKIVVSDCTTRWNSTFLMIKRLLFIKSAVTEVLTEIGIDSLLASEWAKLEEICSLLEPFAERTDTLQSDAMSLSSIIPSLLDLECHLTQFPSTQTLTSSMLKDFKNRFTSILHPHSDQYNPIPAAACLLDPTVASVLLAPEFTALQNAAKSFIISLEGESVLPNVVEQNDSQQGSSQSLTSPPALKKFKFLSNILCSPENSTASQAQGAFSAQLNRYLEEISSTCCTNSLQFWRERRHVYSSIAPLAEDLLAAPASQAYVERIFSVCGLLTAGRRNRMQKSLEMRVFLKLNKHILD